MRHSIQWLVFVFYSVCQTTISFAGLVFVDQSSQVTVSSSTELKISGVPQSLTGTLRQEGSAVITGQSLVCKDAILQINAQEVLITCTYDGSSTPLLILDGDDTILADKPFVCPSLVISGEGNRLLGNLSLSEDLSLDNTIGVTCGLTSKLNKNIILDEGTLWLSNDLACANNVFVGGTGTIEAGSYCVSMGHVYQTDITGSITWHSVSSMQLEGKLPLAADWIFTGTSKIEGDSETIDLSAGGSITVAPNSTLTLRDVYLKGVSDTSLVLTDTSSQLRLDRVIVELSEPKNMTTGGVYVEGDSTFVLRNHDWTFDESATLTVDGAGLVLNVFNGLGLHFTGTLKAPNPLYIAHEKQVASFSYNIDVGTLTLLNGGVIAEVDATVPASPVPSGVPDFSGVTSLSQSVYLGPGDAITITSDTTINGLGGAIYFSRVISPQLTVAAGQTLTLRNIELVGLTNKSIKLETGAKINIGANVIFTIDEDITWSVGTIELTGTTDVFTIRSLGRQRKMTFSSTPVSGSSPSDYVYTVHLKLRSNTVSLQNIELKGLRHITYTTAVVSGSTVKGTIALSGVATVVNDLAHIQQNLFVQGLDNTLRLLLNDCVFFQSLTYDPSMVSALTLSFVTPSSFTGVPRILFENNSCKLSSTNGKAYLCFDAPRVAVKNSGTNSFVAGANSYVSGYRVDIQENPIQQIDRCFTLVPGTILTSTLAQGALVYDDALLTTMRMISLFPETNALLFSREGSCERTRGILLPDRDVKTVLDYDSALALPVIAGNIALYNSNASRFTNLQVHETEDVNLSLEDGVSIVQARTPLSIKEDDIVNVIGGTSQQPNYIQLTSAATIAGKLLFDDNAVLEMHFDETSTQKTLDFTQTSSLDLGIQGTLIISGRGTVQFEENYALKLGASGRLILRDGAQLLLTGGQVVTATGSGTLHLKEGAFLVVNNGSRFVCGNSLDHNITLRVEGGSAVQIGSLLGTELANSYMSFAGSTGVIDFSRGGQLLIGNSGAFECNGRFGTAYAGAITAINFSFGGQLYIAAGGKFDLANNAFGYGGIDWNSLGATVSGSGTIGFISTSILVRGRVQDVLFAKEDATALALILLAVQSNPSLLVSTLFITADGKKKVYTKNGVIITLGANEMLKRDDTAGNLYLTDSATGKNSVYNADGVKQ